MLECVTLEERVFSVKKRFLAMYRKANAGHIGSSLSCAEILVFLKFAWMTEDDTLLLSKGHAVAALYSLLAEANLLTPSEIDSYYGEGTRLSALPPFNTIKEIPFATGSLGPRRGSESPRSADFLRHFRRRARRGQRLGSGPLHSPS
jgi:transketolase